MSKRRIKKKYKVIMAACIAVLIILISIFAIKAINENKPEAPQIEYGEILDTKALEGDK